MTESIHSPRYAALRRALVAARKAAELTQDEVADELGRPQSFVSKVESGERRIDLVELLELAEALGADPLAIVAEVMAVKPRRKPR